MKDTLTQKQEAFTQDLFKGMYQREAYIDAYHPSCALETIDANASRLASNVKVVARLKELNAKTEDDSVATVIERKQRLTKFIREDIESDKGVVIRKDNIAATTELNKMEKVYESGILIDNRTQILITPGMRALAAKEMLEIKEEETKLLATIEEEKQG